MVKPKKREFNKAEKIREMLAKNPEIKFSEVEAEFKKLGQTVAAAQFYTLKKGGSKKIKIKLKERAAEPVVKTMAVAAKASSTTSIDTDTVLKARSLLSQAYRDAFKMLGHHSAVERLYTDIRNELT